MTETDEAGMEQRHGEEAGAIPMPVSPPPPPAYGPVSGLYQWSWNDIFRWRGVEGPSVEMTEGGSLGEVDAARGYWPIPLPLWWRRREEIRLDVDGRYPQMTVSGTLFPGLTATVHWIATLRAAHNGWTGSIWYKDGPASSFPYTNVRIAAHRSVYAWQRYVIIEYTGGGAPKLTRWYRFQSPYFHPVEFEFDTEVGTTRVTRINTCEHPNRPATLPCETLTIEDVYQRAGFDTRLTSGDGWIPSDGVDPNDTWSDQEMHDAMQIYWSRFASHAQWSMWVLFARQHDQGSSLGGIMFDDIGPNHRQGTAMFNDSFIANPPAGDPDPAAWVKRMKFWTACHEMGHAFNLAHSWQKDHPVTWGTSWIPLVNESEARSFMNYPFRVAGGESNFFSDFEYRFSDQELLFMRHAPARFVQMGNADWFDDHGFRQANVSAEPKLRLEVRPNRDVSEFEFLEPIVLETKLTNISPHPVIVDEEIASTSGELTVIVKKQGKPARQWAPYARYCMEPKSVALAPGRSIYKSLYVAAGLNGWDLADPGIYDVQVCCHLGEEDLVSNTLRLRVVPPTARDEEYVAQDFFSEDVGRILALNGSLALESGLNTLNEVVDRLGKRRVAVHARVALGTPLTRNYRNLHVEGDGPDMGPAWKSNAVFKVQRAQTTRAKKLLNDALMTNRDDAAETLGHIDYRNHVSGFSDWLATRDDRTAAARAQTQLHGTLKARGVLDSVLDEIAQKGRAYGKTPKPKAKRKRAKRTRKRVKT